MKATDITKVQGAKAPKGVNPRHVRPRSFWKGWQLESDTFSFIINMIVFYHEKTAVKSCVVEIHDADGYHTAGSSIEPTAWGNDVNSVIREAFWNAGWSFVAANDMEFTDAGAFLKAVLKARRPGFTSMTINQFNKMPKKGSGIGAPYVFGK